MNAAAAFGRCGVVLYSYASSAELYERNHRLAPADVRNDCCKNASCATRITQQEPPAPGLSARSTRVLFKSRHAGATVRPGACGSRGVLLTPRWLAGVPPRVFSFLPFVLLCSMYAMSCVAQAFAP
jgi:hypothetical protein